uniref:Uncharacterized protein n=1 Tax=Trichobilharzia regenti TaxID=157069 RepID=A0AA85IT17_TRIRE|nr:unnamed protein product [Trichobilharzia regenti]
MNRDFDFKRSLQLPSQFDYCETLPERKNSNSTSILATQSETLKMNNSFSPYRYYPPEEFTPTTPPLVVKYRQFNDLPNDPTLLQNNMHPQCYNRPLKTNATPCEVMTPSNLTSETVNTSSTEAQVRWNTASFSPEANTSALKKNLKNNHENHNSDTVTVVHHGRQRSMPVFMPSYMKPDTGVDKLDTEAMTDTENSNESKQLNHLTLIGNSTRSISTNMMNNSTMDPCKGTLTPGNPSSLNLVIDIHLHGPVSDLTDNRMTQSCIQEQDYTKSIDETVVLNKTNCIKCSMDELLTNMDYCTLRCKPHRAKSLIDQRNSSSQSSSNDLNTESSRLSHRLSKVLCNKHNGYVNRISSADTKLDNVVDASEMKCSTNIQNNNNNNINNNNTNASSNNWNSHIQNNQKRSEQIISRLKHNHNNYHTHGYDRKIYINQNNGTTYIDDLRIRRTPMPGHRQFMNNTEDGHFKSSTIDRYSTMPNINNNNNNLPKKPEYFTSSSGTFSQQSVDIPLLIRLLQSSDPDVVSNAAAYLQHLVYRNPSLKEKTRLSGGISALVQLLYSDHTRVCLNAVGVLRNLTCGDTLAIKKELERVGGVRALAWLIENRQVYGTSVDSFKDLNYPVSNSHSHTYHFNGASEYDDLHQAVKSILENAASVLCNLASVSCLKRSVLQEALIPSLLNVIIVPAATETTVYGSKDNGAESIISSMLFRIVTSLVRNISSSEDDDIREQMRQCPQLSTSLYAILHYAVDHGLYDKRSIEHCVCTIRNLCYGLQQPQQQQQQQQNHIADQQHQKQQKSQKQLQQPQSQQISRRSVTPSGQESKAQLTQEKSHSNSLFRIKSSSLSSGKKSKRSMDFEALSDSSSTLLMSQSKSESIPPPYGDVESIKTLIALLQCSSNPYTLEAAAGALQNLTAGNGYSSECIREIIRVNHGLPLLVELLNNPIHFVVATAANALRNSALNLISCSLLGKYALNRIIQALDQHPCGIGVNTQPSQYTPNHLNKLNAMNNSSSEWQLPHSKSLNLSNKLATLSNSEHYQYIEEDKTNMKKLCTVSLLTLCCILIHKKLEHARRFVTLGGVEKCQELLNLCITYGHLSEVSQTDQVVTDDKTTQTVIKLIRQLLFILWEFSELRPIYKLAGWTEADFCIHKRSRLASLVRRRSKRTEIPRRRVNSSYRQYTNEKSAEFNDNSKERFMFSNKIKSNEVISDDFASRCDDLSESLYSLHGQPSSYYIPAQSFVHESQNTDQMNFYKQDKPYGVYLPEGGINEGGKDRQSIFEDDWRYRSDLDKLMEQRRLFQRINEMGNNYSNTLDPNAPDSWV